MAGWGWYGVGAGMGLSIFVTLFIDIYLFVLNLFNAKNPVKKAEIKKTIEYFHTCEVDTAEGCSMLICFGVCRDR